MITLSELKRIAVKNGVPQAVVEKDLALSVALKVIAGSQLASHIVFKGGTAIRKAYFAEARFSEDLDFTVINFDKAKCLNLLRNALEDKNFDGVKFEMFEEEKTSAGLKVAVKYLGPLAHAQRIRFDFNFRENLVEKPAKRKLIDSYSLGQAELFVLSPEELFAEKIHALASRLAPRDLYDTWFLFEKGVNIDKRILDKKFSHYNENFDAKKVVENIRIGKDNWNRDLQHLINKVPKFEQLEMEVEKKLFELT